MRYALILIISLISSAAFAASEVPLPNEGTFEPEVHTSTAPAVQERPSGLRPARSPARAAAPATYRVWIWQENGDCLWSIAKKVYGDPALWKKIYNANKEQISDPRVIFPKQVLVIPPRDE